MHYADIGDYLSREEKLAIVAAADNVTTLDAVEITQNEHGDWLNQRSNDFAEFSPLGDKAGVELAIFNLYSAGLKTPPANRGRADSVRLARLTRDRP